METATAETVADERPRPPDDLDTRLVAHYPLRGLVLREDGSARVRFTVELSGAVSTGAVLYETGPEYAAACRRMLEGTLWTPARSGGTAVPFTSAFDCRFEHGGAQQARSVAPPVIAAPPTQPDYGRYWWEKYGVSFVAEDVGAQLRITVGTDGRVQVDSVIDGSDDEVASVCTRMLREGEPWVPAKNARGEAVPYHGTFRCVLDANGVIPRMKLSTKAIGASGPLQPGQVAVRVADHLDQLSACFKIGLFADNRALGQHWLAFEIRPAGDVGRVEWIERPFSDAKSSACLTDLLHRWRFPAASERTIADIELYLGTNAQ